MNTQSIHIYLTIYLPPSSNLITLQIPPFLIKQYAFCLQKKTNILISPTQSIKEGLQHDWII